MFNQRETRRNESFDGVATFATAFISAPGELSGMRICMAIATDLMGQLLFEISGSVALLARKVAMLAAQRKIRQVMIERVAANDIPTFRGMTFRTRITETAAMWILMTGRAVRKRQAEVLHKRRDRFITDFFPRDFFEMAFRARDLFVFPGEHKLRAFVCKFCRGFPARVVVTALAVRAKLPAMLIRMTTRAGLRKPEEGFNGANRCIGGKIFPYISGMVAIATRCLRVLAFQNIPGLAMIKIGFAFLPMYQRKLHAVMIAMTRRAKFRFLGRAGRRKRGDPSMKSARDLQPLCKCNMAFQTFGIARLLAHFMAGKAFRQTLELRVRPG